MSLVAMDAKLTVECEAERFEFFEPLASRQRRQNIPTHGDLEGNSPSLGDQAAGDDVFDKARVRFATLQFLLRQEEVKQWIEEVLQIKMDSPDFILWIRDGVILCQLMNKLRPGSVPKINTSNHAFLLMDNIACFRAACEAYGLNAEDLFLPIDLYERKNIPKVISCLLSLGEAAEQANFRPVLQYLQANEVQFTEHQISKAEEDLRNVGDFLGDMMAGHDDADTGSCDSSEVSLETSSEVSLETAGTELVGDRSRSASAEAIAISLELPAPNSASSLEISQPDQSFDTTDSMEGPSSVPSADSMAAEPAKPCVEQTTPTVVDIPSNSVAETVQPETTNKVPNQTESAATDVAGPHAEISTTHADARVQGEVDSLQHNPGNECLPQAQGLPEPGSESPPTERTRRGSNPGKPKRLYTPLKGTDRLDLMLSEWLNTRGRELSVQLPCPLKRLGPGKYMLGFMRLNMKLLNDKIVVRNGSSWERVDVFFMRYATRAELSTQRTQEPHAATQSHLADKPGGQRRSRDTVIEEVSPRGAAAQAGEGSGYARTAAVKSNHTEHVHGHTEPALPSNFAQLFENSLRDGVSKEKFVVTKKPDLLANPAPSLRIAEPSEVAETTQSYSNFFFSSLRGGSSSPKKKPAVRYTRLRSNDGNEEAQKPAAPKRNEIRRTSLKPGLEADDMVNSSPNRRRSVSAPGTAAKKTVKPEWR